MLPYIILSLSPVLWGFFANALYRSPRNIQKRSRLVVILTGISLFLMIALRSRELGSTDSAIYYGIWETLSQLSFQEMLIYSATSRLEGGFLFVTWVLSHIPCFTNPQFIFVFSGLIIAVSYCSFVYKYCDDVILGLTMFICLGLYSFVVQGLRQAVAMSICVLAIPYCLDRKFLQFVLMVVLASLFHKTAVTFLAVYFLYNRKMDAKTLLVTVGILTVVVMFSGELVTIMNGVFDMSYNTPVDSGGFVAVAVYVLTLAVGWFFRKKSENDKEYCFFYYLTFLGFSIYILRYFGTLALERVSFFFMEGQLILLPNSLRNTKKGKKLMIVIIWILSLLLYYYRIRNSTYRFFWQEEIFRF